MISVTEQSMANEISLPCVVYQDIDRIIKRTHSMLPEDLGGKAPAAAAFSRGHLDIVPFLIDGLLCRRQKQTHGNNCNGTADCARREGHLQPPGGQCSAPPLAFKETSKVSEVHTNMAWIFQPWN